MDSVTICKYVNYINNHYVDVKIINMQWALKLWSAHSKFCQLKNFKFQIPVFATGFPTHNSSWHVIRAILVYKYYIYVQYMFWPIVFSAKSCRHTAFGEKKDFSLEELTSIKCPLQVEWKPRRSEQKSVAKRYLCLIYINIILIYMKVNIPCLCLDFWTLSQF